MQTVALFEGKPAAFRRSAALRRRSFFVVQSELLSIQLSVSEPASFQRAPMVVVFQATRPFLFPRWLLVSQQQEVIPLRSH